MSKRLQVLLSDQEYKKLAQHAKLESLPLGTWVRSVLRRVTESNSSKSIDDKLKVLHRAQNINAPTASITEMIREIEDGYR